MSPRILRPARLHPGDLVAVAAPSSPPRRSDLFHGIDCIAAEGFPVTYRSDLFEKSGYLAGDDSRRSEELNAHFRDPAVKAILLARGGYGLSRIMEKLKLGSLRKKPKIVAGYSDATALLLHLQQSCGLVVYHGPFVTDSPRDLSRLLRALASPPGERKISGLRILRRGKASAPVTGGNLSLLAHSVGTPFEVLTDRRILFVEEVNEAPYRVDRLIRQLVLAGKFRKIRGLLVGRLAGGGASARRNWERLLLDAVGDRNIPVAASFPSGHGPGNTPFPLGVGALFDTRSRSVTFAPALAP